MCPSYLATREEKDSTGGRARVLREAIDGTVVAGFEDPAVAAALDLCLACKGCASDCPSPWIWRRTRATDNEQLHDYRAVLAADGPVTRAILAEVLAEGVFIGAEKGYLSTGAQRRRRGADHRYVRARRRRRRRSAVGCRLAFT